MFFIKIDLYIILLYNIIYSMSHQDWETVIVKGKCTGNLSDVVITEAIIK